MVDWNRRAHIVDSILDAATMTPMVRLHRVVPAEPLSPELRIDDRAAIAWLEERVQGIPRDESER